MEGESTPIPMVQTLLKGERLMPWLKLTEFTLKSSCSDTVCFLCRNHRPSRQQSVVALYGSEAHGRMALLLQGSIQNPGRVTFYAFACHSLRLRDIVDRMVWRNYGQFPHRTLYRRNIWMVEYYFYIVILSRDKLRQSVSIKDARCIKGGKEKSNEGERIEYV